MRETGSSPPRAESARSLTNNPNHTPITNTRTIIPRTLKRSYLRKGFEMGLT